MRVTLGHRRRRRDATHTARPPSRRSLGLGAGGKRVAPRRMNRSMAGPARADAGHTFSSFSAAYATVHVALRLWISPVLNIDDAREAVFSQTLDWGYQSRQPPLYTWLAWATVRLAGASVASLTRLKYAVLAVAYAFTWATARRVLTEPRLRRARGVLVAPAPAHRVVRSRRPDPERRCARGRGGHRPRADPPRGRAALRAVLWLGVALALGTLSKLNYLVFAVALGLAALSLPPFRRRLRDPRIAGTVLVGLVLVLPYARWLWTGEDDLLRLYAEQLVARRRALLRRRRPGWPRSRAAGARLLRGAARAPVPRSVPGGLSRRDGGPRRDPGRSLIERTLLAGVGLLTGGALLGLVGQLKFRWVIPLLFLLPIYAFWRLDRLPLDAARRRRLRAYAGVLVLVEALMIAGIVGQTHLRRPRRRARPAEHAVRRGRPGRRARRFRHGTIVAGRGPLAGNLRLAFPTPGS